MKRVVALLLALTALSSSWVGATTVAPHCSPHREVIHVDDTAISLAGRAGVDQTHFFAWMNKAPAATRRALRRMHPGDVFELCLRTEHAAAVVASIHIKRDEAGRKLARREASTLPDRPSFAAVIGSVRTSAIPLAAGASSIAATPTVGLRLTELAPGRSLSRALERRLGRHALVMAVLDFARHQWHLPAKLPKGSRCTVALLAKPAARHERQSRLAYVELDYHGRRRRVYPYVDAHGRDFVVGSRGRSYRVLTPLPPLRRARISSGWGWRIQPVLGGNEFHHGIDYAARPGTPIRATMAGVVDISNWHGNYGRMVEIRHAHGFVTRYGHLRAFARNARVGRHVHRGQIIGYVGTSGLSTGPHLYYEVWEHGRRIDPLKHRHLIVAAHLSAVERRQFKAFIAKVASRETLPRSAPVQLAAAS
jgi:hypothetical protein